MKKALQWSPLVLGLAFLLALAYTQRERTLRGQNDFAAFYTGAVLAGTPDLYSRQANLALIKAQHGFNMETVVYIRPPFYAALLKPLAALPYLPAYAVFSIATLLSILWFVARFSKECPALPFYAAFSIPMMASLLGGQDTPLLLPIFGGFILLSRRNKDFAAGLVLSLCAIKFHLFVFIPLMLVLKRRWATLLGGTCGTVALTVLGMIVTGPGSIIEYVSVLRDPWINASPTVMPNLHGLAAILQGGLHLEAGLVVAVCLAFLFFTIKTNNLELLMAFSLICGLLVSYHSAIFDDILLFPVFILVLSASDNVPLRALSALVLTPLVYVLWLSGSAYGAVLPISLLLMLALGCGSVYAATPAKLAQLRR